MASRKIGAECAGPSKRPVAKRSRPSSKQADARMQAELLFWFRRMESRSAGRSPQLPDEPGRFYLFSRGRPQPAAH